MADIDAFKLFNNSLGHQEGDHCLSAVAAVLLLSAGRASDLGACYGGEEMVFLMPGADLAVTMAEKLHATCESLTIHHPTSPISRVVTISLGMAACIPSKKSSTEFLVEQADAALYRAKYAGRNRVSE